MANDKKTVQATTDPRMQVSGPSVGLLVTGILGVVLELTSFISLLIGTSVCTFLEDDIPDKYVGFFEGSFWLGSSLVGLLVAGFIIYAALKMKELTQWGLCVVASVLAMIPCISPCCIVGLPMGIWCLVVLTKDDIKAAFH
ncbi:MAG: hypothetical protein ACETWK_09830 [Candidatus Aminicenantaceae bacterium]